MLIAAALRASDNHRAEHHPANPDGRTRHI
jgi:hypothetical protein